jgi:pimeloyl-ACP methyl ester carboxylesterase
VPYFARAGWKYQIGPWVRAGYRVVAPDMLGYGETDKPYDPEEYSLRRISDDLASILDLIRVRKVVSSLDRGARGGTLRPWIITEGSGREQ